jgi:DNA-binding CsgD family transcriptional regulator
MLTKVRTAGLFDALYTIPETGDYQPFLDELRSATGSSVVNGILSEPGVPGGHVTSVSGIAASDYAALEAAYFEAHGGYNPMMAAVQDRLCPGAVLRASDFAPFPALRQTAYFRDFMHPLDADYTAGIVVESGPTGTSWLSLSRPVGAPDYGRVEMALIAELSAPLQRVCRLLAAIPGAGYSWELLEASGTAAMVVDADFRCRRATAAMDALLAEGSLLTMRGRSLYVIEPAARRRLLALCDALRTGSRDQAPELELGDTRGARWALTALTGLVGLRSGDVLLLLRRCDDAVAPEKALVDRFGLTPAEARCALALARAPDNRSLARLLGVAPNTVKSQLRAAFRKTGTGNRVRLLALLIREGLIEPDVASA